MVLCIAASVNELVLTVSCILQIYFKGEEVRACIVTCGGLCPGINTVIREIVCGLWTQYGVRDIYGIEVSGNISQVGCTDLEFVYSLCIYFFGV